MYRDWGGIIGGNAMCVGGGGYYTVGNNAIYVQFKGVKGLVIVHGLIENFSKL